MGVKGHRKTYGNFYNSMSTFSEILCEEEGLFLTIFGKFTDRYKYIIILIISTIILILDRMQQIMVIKAFFN